MTRTRDKSNPQSEIIFENRYKDQTLSVESAIEHGHLNVWLEGKKLKGGYPFVRIRREAKDQWLLVKMNDGEADPSNDPLVTQPDSVLSGLSLEETTCWYLGLVLGVVGAFYFANGFWLFL